MADNILRPMTIHSISSKASSRIGANNLAKVLKSKHTRRTNHSTKFNAPQTSALYVEDRLYQISSLEKYGFQIENDGSIDSGKNYKGWIGDTHTKLFEVQFRARSGGTNQYILQCRFNDLSLETERKLLKHISQTQNKGVERDSINTLTYDQIAEGQSEHVPSTPISNTAETATAPNKTRLIATALLCLALVGILIGVIAFAEIRNHVNISNAALVGNYLPIQASTAGLVTDISYREGQTVESGDVLFRVQNKEVEKEMAFATADLIEAEAAVTTLEGLIKDYHEKLELVAESIVQRTLSAKAELRKARIESTTQARLTESKQKLFTQGLISKQEYENSRALNEILEANIDLNKAQVGILQIDYRAITEKGILSIGDVLEDQLGQLKAELAGARSNVARSKSHLDAISRNQEEVRAPTTGRIYAVYRKKGEFVKLADPILSISLNDNYWASGSVSQQEAHKIRPGQEVQVEIASLDMKVAGQVAAVGHRAVYTQGGWSQDFRTAALAVPVKVWLPNLPDDVPSGLRMKMVVDLGFKWPWQKDGQGVIADMTATLLNGGLADTNQPALGTTSIVAESATSSPNNTSSGITWAEKLTTELSAHLNGVPETTMMLEKDGDVKIRVGERASFLAGESRLSQNGRRIIESVGRILLTRKDLQITVAGHTDSWAPNSNSTFKTNQDLSMARAESVVEYLNGIVGVPIYRLSAKGYAATSPIATNLSELGRSQNRRVELLLSQKFGNTTNRVTSTPSMANE